MVLDAALKKIIVGKPFGLTMVKGAQSSGKTMTAAYRALYLKSGYCLYEGEKVLVVSGERQNIDVLEKCYNEAKDEYDYDYATLFSLLEEERVNFYTIKELVDRFYLLYIRENNLNPLLISEDEKILVIRECINELKNNYKRVTFIKDKNEAFIIDEINWIKSCDFKSMEEYKAADRFGRKYENKKGPARLIKNSVSREAAYELMLLYNKKLSSRNFVDGVDKELFALQAILGDGSYRYTHMVVDDAHKLTKLQLKILMALKSKKAYSSMMMMVDHKAEVANGAWIVKGRKQKALGFDVNIKNCYIKKSILPVQETHKDKPMDIQMESKLSMEKYLFLDVRHRRRFEFGRDTSNYEELVLMHGDKDIVCSKEELRSLPVYSNIAAGEPIAINPEVEDTFNIPQYWIKGMKDCFMLKVKGDSMIGAEIEDGDFVVIRKQTMASNRDIVAVDIEGSATLKRLWMDKNDVLLMPENEKYSPISIKNRDAVILGVVVGIIKYAA